MVVRYYCCMPLLVKPSFDETPTLRSVMRDTYKKIDMVNISITNKCILKCPSCPTGRKNYKGSTSLEYLSVEDAEKIAEKVVRLYGPQMMYLHIWNEPLIHPHLFEILDLLHQFGHSAYMSSNLNLKQDWKRLLAAPALKTLVISMSGYHQKVYERGHRGGNVKLVLENLKAIGRYTRSSSAQVLMNFHRYNDNKEDELLLAEKCREYGIVFEPYIASTLQDHVEEGVIAGKELWQELADVTKLVQPRLLFEPFHFEKISGLAQVSCHSQDHILVLDHKGQICTCTHKGPEDYHRVGDFLELSADEIWEKKKNFDPCKRCRSLGLHMEYVFACFFDRPSDNSDEIIRLLRNTQLHPDWKDAEIYIFGAGMTGGAVGPFLKHKGYNVRGFIDQNPEKVGKQIHKLPVFGLAEIEDTLSGAVVLDTVRALPFKAILEKRNKAHGVTILNAESFFHHISGVVQGDTND